MASLHEKRRLQGLRVRVVLLVCSGGFILELKLGLLLQKSGRKLSISDPKVVRAANARSNLI